MRILFYIWLLLPMMSSGQDSAFSLIRKTTGSFSGFSADNLGNLYLITRDNQLKKLNEKGDSVGIFNVVRNFGKLYSINPVNPFKTLLYYKDFRTIVVLDRLLNTVNVIDLRRVNVLQVRAIAASYDNNIWVFDEQQSVLKKIGEDGRILSETVDLRIVLGDAPMPVQIFDQSGYVYLYDPSKGIFVFDYYGALKTKIALLNWKNVQVLDKTIVGIVDGKLMSYTTGTLKMIETLLPEHIRNAVNIQISPLGIYVLRDDGVFLYKDK